MPASGCVSWCRVRRAIDHDLPDVLEQLVQEFEAFMKKQKLMTEELNRFSNKPFNTVGDGIAAQHQVCLRLTGIAVRSCSDIVQSEHSGVVATAV